LSAPPASIASLQSAPFGRWSVDGWIVLRGGAGTAALAGGKPTYGASQAGLVLRYRLSADSPARPAAYLRATTSPGVLHQRDLALGLALRPDRKLPLAIMAEARLLLGRRRSAARVGVMAVSEIAPFDLPLGFEGEAYGQAGLVGGAAAGSFAEGQLRLEHCFSCRQGGAAGRADFSAGLGLWGGVQSDVARLDGGPGLSLRLPVGPAAALRFDADWRFRLAGNAAPGSGPVATLSASFWEARP